VPEVTHLDGPADDHVSSAVERGDLDELIRLVDGLCADRDWAGLEALRRLAQRAAESTGRQLWPAAAHTEYRLALEAPGPQAAAVLVEGAGRFAPGPLAEVAASTHSWSELSEHLEPGPTAAMFAHERVVRGEDLTDVEVPGPPVLELPVRLAAWEPPYAVAEYRAHEAHFPAPESGPNFAPIAVPSSLPPRLGPDEGVDALTDTVRAWTSGSNGRAEAVLVSGDAAGAVGVLGVERPRMAAITAADAVARLAWAGASGGAHGNRPGAASGRFAAWWAAAALSGLLDEWPPEPGVLGEAIAGLHWYLWDASGASTGWTLRLAIEDPATGRAWALSAVDHS
jgi:hypothetical protein